MQANRLFDTDAQGRPRGKPRFYSLVAGQLRRYTSARSQLIVQLVKAA